ncbi:MAG: hypothetical protein LQ349_005224 [Xanthoria aureola]|nr:MAG: hypothetical protein LQ349_005224 [Xanthoria aureola]
MQEGLRIADVGAGTGIWLIELSKTLPGSTQLDGFDIDLSQLPPKEWLPSNVATHTLDVSSVLPPSLVGKYDIVHLRLFIAIVKHNDPVPILRNLVAMLTSIEPGGYLQWDEHDHVSQKVIARDPAVDTSNVQAMLDFVRPFDLTMGLRTWVPSLAKILAAQGLVDSRLDRYPLPPEFYQYDTDNVFGVYEEISKKVLDKRGKGEGDKLRKLIAAAFVDSRKGVAISHDKVVVTGRKPASLEGGHERGDAPDTDL